ncbi:MAG TPA: cupin domain-containing protein [Desulfobulbaceae bacterium]|nr:MAG: cupin [Deltaproteobacteria bacterium RIFOXYD12_FULL_53_23]HCC55624.1 cupin domain-containing protein [Desulfobulbaceae bacterium]
MKRLFCVLLLVLLLSNNISAAEIKGVAVKMLSKSDLSWDGRILPDYPKGKPEITILMIKIQPGVVLPLHKHPVINAGILLSGELTVVTDDGKVLQLKTGEGIIEVVNTWHYGKNEGNFPAEIVVFYAGTSDAPITLYQ